MEGMERKGEEVIGVRESVGDDTILFCLFRLQRLHRCVSSLESESGQVVELVEA